MTVYTGDDHRHCQLPLTGTERRRTRLADRLLAPYTVTRIMYLIPLFGTFAVGFGSPTSLTARLLDMASPWGTLLVCLIAALLVCAAVDVVVNDLMPTRYGIACLRRHRHTFAGITGGAYALLAWVTVTSELPIPGRYTLTVYYLLIGGAFMLHSLASALRFRDALQ